MIAIVRDFLHHPNMNYTPTASTPVKSSGCCLFSCGGCLGLGCLTIFAFVALTTFGIYYTARVALPKLVMAYTTDTPAAAPAAPSEASIASARAKFSSLFRGITGRGSVASEEFTKDEVPALVTVFSKTPGSKFLPTLQIKDGKLHMAFSLPLKTIEEYFPLLSGTFPELHSRYFVGDLDFVPEIDVDSFKVTVSNVNVNGHTLSGIFLRQVNRIINSLLAETSAHIPIESPTQSDYRKIPLSSITGIEVKKESLIITLSAKNRPIEIPPTPESSPHQ